MWQCFQWTISETTLIAVSCDVHFVAHIFASRDTHQKFVLKLNQLIIVCYPSKYIV